MMHKVIAQKAGTYNSIKVIYAEDKAYFFNQGVLYEKKKDRGAGIERLGECRSLNGMSKQDKLVLQYDADLKKKRIVSLYSDKVRIKPVVILPLSHVGAGHGSGKPFEIRGAELFDPSRDLVLGKVLSAQDIAERVVIPYEGGLAGLVTHVLWDDVYEKQRELDWELDFIETRIGRAQIPDLRMLANADVKSGGHIICTLSALIKEGTFVNDRLDRVRFREGQFLQEIVRYRTVLENSGPGRFPEGVVRMNAEHILQNAIVLAVRMNIGFGHHLFRSSGEYEKHVVSNVLKEHAEAYIRKNEKITVLDDIEDDPDDLFEEELQEDNDLLYDTSDVQLRAGDELQYGLSEQASDRDVIAKADKYTDRVPINDERESVRNIDDKDPRKGIATKALAEHNSADIVPSSFAVVAPDRSSVKVKNNTGPKRPANKKANNKKYYEVHNACVDIPAAFQEQVKAVIAELCSRQKGLTGVSGQALAGVMMLVFKERAYVLPENDHYKFILALGRELKGRTVRPGIKLMHTKLKSFFGVLAYALNIEQLRADTFEAEFKKALLLTLIDANYGTHMADHGGLLWRYKPGSLGLPRANCPVPERLVYHTLVLRLIEADAKVNDPFDLFFVPDQESTEG